MPLSADDLAPMHVDPESYNKNTPPPTPPATQATSSPVAQMGLASADDSAMRIDSGRDEIPTPAKPTAARRSSRLGERQAAAVSPATPSSRRQQSSRRQTKHKSASAGPATPLLETKPQVKTSSQYNSDTPCLTEIIDLTEDLEEVSVLPSFFLSMSNLKAGSFSGRTCVRQEELLQGIIT